MSGWPRIDFHVSLGECMGTLKDRFYSDVKISWSDFLSVASKIMFFLSWKIDYYNPN